jgi:hypothetical protein
LEVLISVTLIAMMAVALWSVFRISLSSWSRGIAFIDANQRHRSILDLVKKQIASTYPVIAPIDLATGGAVYPIFAGSPNSMQFVTLSSLRFNDNPGLTMVSYDLVSSEGGSYALVEREAQYLGMDPARESPFDRTDDTQVPIFENLVSFSFEYLDPGTKDRPTEWVKSWSAQETSRLPGAVSMSMIARDRSGNTLSRHLVVPILSKPQDPRLNFVNPLEDPRRRRILNDPR